jgi:hypothetical protein
MSTKAKGVIYKKSKSLIYQIGNRIAAPDVVSIERSEEIKQHLRIKAFYGTAPNAVRIQLWIAITVYVRVAILKKEMQLKPSLYTILDVLSLTLFEKTPISEALSQPELPLELEGDRIQLTLFDFSRDGGDSV